MSCNQLNNSHDENILDCGAELSKGQEYLTVLNSRGIRMLSGFEVVNLSSGQAQTLITSRGCLVKKAEGRYLIRSTATNEARIIDMSQHANRAPVELYDYTGQSASIACNDQLRTVGSAFSLQELIQTNLQANLQKAVQLEYDFIKPIRPKAQFSLADAAQSLPLRGETDERVYELKILLSNLLSTGKVEAVCRLQLDRTPPKAFVSVNARKPEAVIEVHGTKNIVSIGLTDSISFLADSSDGANVSYCLVPLDDNFDETNEAAKKVWTAGTERKDCEGHKLLAASPGTAVASDVKSGFWSIRFQAADAVGNIAPLQNQVILISNKDSLRLIKDNARASVGSKSSLQVVESALRAESIRNSLPTRYERDSEREVALSGLLRAYYQETVSVTINAHNSSVRSLALSEDGRVLVSSSFDRTLKLWNVETGQNIWSVASESLMHIAISPNRKYIAGIDLTGSVLAFDGENGSYLRKLKAASRPNLNPTQIHFAPDGLGILVNSGNDIEVLSFENGEILRVLQGHTKGVKDFGLIPDSQIVVSAAADKTLRFWDLQTGSNLKTIEMKVIAPQSVPQSPNELTVSPDGKKIAVKFDTGSVGLWGDDGNFLNWSAKTSAINSVMAVKRDGTLFTADSTIKVWDADNLTQSFSEHVSPIVAMLLSKDQQRLFTASDDSTIRIWNLKIIEEKKTIEAPVEVTSLVYSQDGEGLISGSMASGDLLLWSLKSGDAPKILGGHKSSVGSLTLSANGKYVATGGDEGDLIVREYAGSCCQRFDFKPAEAITSVSLSHDGRYLVAATINGGVKIWDMSSSLEPRDVAGPSFGGTVAAISPDGLRIAVAGLGAQSNVEIRDSESGKVVFPIMGNSGFMSGLAFSTDSQRLATFGPSSNSINIWDLEARKVVSRVVGDFKDVVSLAMTGHGSRAVAGTLVGKFLLIDFEQELQTLIPMHGTLPSFAVAIAPDGRSFATGGYDKAIRIWDLDNGPIHKKICARLKSYLNPELCSVYAQ